MSTASSYYCLYYVLFLELYEGRGKKEKKGKKGGKRGKRVFVWAGSLGPVSYGHSGLSSINLFNFTEDWKKAPKSQPPMS